MNPPGSAPQPSLAASAGKRRPLVSLTPLIDVVFILLVFFMLASSFLDWRAIDLSVPARASAGGTLEGALLIEVRSGGLRLGGAPVGAGELVGEVRERLAEDPETRILVKPAEGVTLQQAVDVLDRLAAIPAAEISMIRDPSP